MARASAVIAAALASLMLGATANAAVYTVKVDAETFSPAQLTISPGDTVVWEWGPSIAPGVPIHDVVSGTGPTDPNVGAEFTSGAPVAGPNTFTHTFNNAGSFDYFCSTHFAIGMTGVVDVVESVVAVPSLDLWALLFVILLLTLFGQLWLRRNLRRRDSSMIGIDP